MKRSPAPLGDSSPGERPPARRRLRAGLAGAGIQGRRHLGTLLDRDDVELAGVSDSSAAALQGIPTGIPRFSSLHELLQVPGLDAVILALPHDLHAASLAACVDAGVHVLKEKPLARTLAEGWRLVELARPARAVIALGTQRRHARTVQHLARRLSTRTSPVVFDYVYSLNLLEKDSEWRKLRDRAGGGSLLDMGFHAFDLLAYLFGVPHRVAAFTSDDFPRLCGSNAVETRASALLRYADGSVGTITMGDFHRPHEESLTIWVDGHSLRLDPAGLWLQGTDSLRLESPQDEVTLLHLQLTDFIQAVERGTRPRGTLESGLAAMTVIDACYRSLRTESTVSVDPLPVTPRDVPPALTGTAPVGAP